MQFTLHTPLLPKSEHQRISSIMPLRLNFDTAVASIKAHYYAAAQYPTLYEEGIRWYYTAHSTIVDVALRQRVHLDVAVAVVAALSPNNKWRRNVVDAENCLKASANNASEYSIRCSTYGQNKTKAFRIARGESYHAVLGGNKVWSFFKNLRHPDNDQVVTVDGHAVAVALGLRISLSKSPQLSDKQYELVAEAYRQATREINADRLVGDVLLPSQVQAICWVYYRFLHNIN